MFLLVVICLITFTIFSWPFKPFTSSFTRLTRFTIIALPGKATLNTLHWLSLVYSLYSVYSIFTPTWISIVFNCPSSASCFIQCSLVHWLRLCSREIVCTCRTFRTFVRIAVYLNFHCKTNMTQLMINEEKNIISLRSLTAALQLLEKETAEERWTHQTPETHSL